LTQDEILDALHKVVQENKHYTTWTVSTPHLVALVNLAIEHEREACAKVCESIDMEAFGVLPVRTVMITSHCAEAIRARGHS
jgi:hypothetical protein